MTLQASAGSPANGACGFAFTIRGPGGLSPWWVWAKPTVLLLLLLFLLLLILLLILLFARFTNKRLFTLFVKRRANAHQRDRRRLYRRAYVLFVSARFVRADKQDTLSSGGKTGNWRFLFRDRTKKPSGHETGNMNGAPAGANC